MSGNKKQEKSSRQRGENWSKEEKAIFLEIMSISAPIVESKLTDTNTNTKKRQEWLKIQKRLLELSGSKREISQIQGVWRRMKLSAKKNVNRHKRESKATGGGSPPPSPNDEDLKIKDLCPTDFVEDTNKFDSDAFHKVIYDKDCSGDSDAGSEGDNNEPIVLTSVEFHDYARSTKKIVNTQKGIPNLPGKINANKNKANEKREQTEELIIETIPKELWSPKSPEYDSDLDLGSPETKRKLPRHQTEIVDLESTKIVIFTPKKSNSTKRKLSMDVDLESTKIVISTPKKSNSTKRKLSMDVDLGSNEKAKFTPKKSKSTKRKLSVDQTSNKDTIINTNIKFKNTRLNQVEEEHILKIQHQQQELFHQKEIHKLELEKHKLELQILTYKSQDSKNESKHNEMKNRLEAEILRNKCEMSKDELKHQKFRLKIEEEREKIELEIAELERDQRQMQSN